MCLIRFIKPSGLLLFLSCMAARSLSCGGFATSINIGSQIMTEGIHVAEVSLGDLPGYYESSNAAYQTFLNSGHPLAVHPEPSGAASSKLIVSADRTMRLSWSDGSNPLPVQYRVYMRLASASGSGSTNPMQLMGTTADRFYVLSDLTYLQDYEWSIEAFDTYGRATMSDVFSFSIAPGVGSLYCAPNPFKAGNESTTFIFNFSGFGSAKFSVYSLPHVDLVFSTTLDGMQDGVNTYVYNGTDAHDRSLYNGVYMAVLEKKGDQKYETERFKFLVVK